MFSQFVGTPGVKVAFGFGSGVGRQSYSSSTPSTIKGIIKPSAIQSSERTKFESQFEIPDGTIFQFPLI